MAARSFDYVIVGAGTAGCVLANRLSADSSLRVALIEAGPSDAHIKIRVPAAVAAANNYLLNPDHPDFPKVGLEALGPFALDARVEKLVREAKG